MQLSSSIDINSKYSADRQRRSQLLQMATQIEAVLLGLEMADELAAVQRLKVTIESEAFKVLILGEFNTGKSTFINALLGEEILPSYATPATAIINEIKWDSNKSASLHFHEADRPPMTIPVEELEDYVVIKDNSEEIKESPYSHLELFWPVELCRNHVEVIDSPGLNESEVREQITLNYLRKVDAVIFILTALRLGPSLHEKETLRTLRAMGHDEPFFIVNQFDLLQRERDRKAVTVRAKERFLPFTKRGEEQSIHFISALHALKGRESTNPNPELVQQSGILPLEEVLNNFLSEERSRLKSRRAAMELSHSVSQAQKAIPDKQAYLRTPLFELRQRYSNAQVQLDQLRTDKGHIIRRIERFQRELRILVSSKLNDFFEEIEGNVVGWVSDYPVKLKISLNVEKQITDIVEDIKVVLDTNLEGAFSTWSENTLMPFLDQSANGLKRDLERLTNNFEADLKRTRIELLGTRMTPDDLSLENTGPKNALERALAAAGGFFLMGVSGAGLGAVFGWREVVSAVLPHIGIVIFSTALGLPLIPIVLTTGTIKGVKSTNKIIEHVKIEISKTYQRQLRGSVSAQSERIAQQLDREFDQLSDQLERGLQMQIDRVSEQVETAMCKQEEGQQAVDEKESEINSMEKQLSGISIELFEFLNSLDQG